MQLKNSYWWFKSAISPEVCQQIIDLGVSKIEADKQSGKSVEAYTFGDKQKSAVNSGQAMPQGEFSVQTLKEKGVSEENTYARDSEVAWLNDQWIYDLILPYIREANEKAGWKWDWDGAEQFQFTKYNPGGFYSWHKDGGSDWNSVYRRYIYGVNPNQPKGDGRLPDSYVYEDSMVGKVRKISMTLNLNPPGQYEGGDLKFDFGHHSNTEKFWNVEEIRPQGSLIVFPSFLDHCVTPLTRGTRYSLVLWCLGKPFK